MRNVTNRLLGLLGQDQLIKDLLEAVYATRNSFVHRGHFPHRSALIEVNLLKFVVENAISAFFGWLDVLPTTSSLSRFYEHILQSNPELTDRERIISRIRRKRAKLKAKGA